MQYRGTMRLELLRKAVHILAGVAIVLLFQAQILDTTLFGLLILVFAAILLFNLKYERETLTKLLSVNRADAKVPGLDILFFFAGSYIVLLIFPLKLALASIMILSFGDAVAHLISRSFGATQTMLTKTTYLEGTIAGIIAATLSSWIYVPFWAAIIASCAAMLVEAGELRIGDHHMDDNLIIPIVAAVTLWVVSLVVPF